MTQQIKMEFDVPAAMRDGVILRANVLRPADDGTYPVALTRLPYGKDFITSTPILDAPRLARAGYIVVIQDVRGRFASEGTWTPFVHEASDGYDTVEWAAALPGSSGNVGMFGASYFGFTQWAAAIQAPPHLKAIMPSVTWGDTQDGNPWRGGALELGLITFWQIGDLAFDVLLKRYKDEPQLERAHAALALVNEINRLRTEGVFSLPLREFEPLKKLGIAPEFFDLIAHPNDRTINMPFTVSAAYDRINVPAYNVGGWYDIFLQGTFQNFSALRTGGSTSEARQAKVLIGPWSHVNQRHVVGVDFGLMANASFLNLQTDLTGLTQRWFDYWLKGIDNGITREPPVKLFIMGENVWRDENEWPLVRTQYTPFYLHHTGRDGSLSTEPPGNEPPDHYTYDPANPTPTYGGALLMHDLHRPGAQDQREIEARDDVLVYSSEPLPRDMEVTGPVIVRLWAASDARDTDFVARLVDVHPDGYAQTLTDGIIRARYRNGGVPELLNPGQANEFTIDLWCTANVFKAGHRLRLDIASASFPRWDRNPNTGAAFGVDAVMQPAQQTILHDAAHPSHVVLPVIPR